MTSAKREFKKSWGLVRARRRKPIDERGDIEGNEFNKAALLCLSERLCPDFLDCWAPFSYIGRDELFAKGYSRQRHASIKRYPTRLPK